MNNKALKKENKNPDKKSSAPKTKIPFISLGIIGFGYLLLYFFNRPLFLKSLNQFIKLSAQIIPFLVIVFVIMFLNIMFIKPSTIKKHLGEQSGFMGYIYAIVAGIISVGSVYMWYPLLKELKETGMSNKLVAVFIYNRSIKLHLLPVLILYFGIKFSVVLTLLTILFSLVIALTVQKFIKE